MYVCASHVGDEDDGGASGPDGAGGAGGVCRENSISPFKKRKKFIQDVKKMFGAKKSKNP